MNINLIQCVESQKQLNTLIELFGFDTVCQGLENPNHLFNKYSGKWVEWVENKYPRKHHRILRLKGASLYVSDNKIQQWYEWHKGRVDKAKSLTTFTKIIIPYYEASKKTLPNVFKEKAQSLKSLLLGIDEKSGRLTLSNSLIKYVFGLHVIDIHKWGGHGEDAVYIGDKDNFNKAIELCKAFGDTSTPSSGHLRFFAPSKEVAELVIEKLETI